MNSRMPNLKKNQQKKTLSPRRAGAAGDRWACWRWVCDVCVYNRSVRKTMCRVCVAPVDVSKVGPPSGSGHAMDGAVVAHQITRSVDGARETTPARAPPVNQ